MLAEEDESAIRNRSRERPMNMTKARSAPTIEGERVLESAKNLLFRVRQDNVEWFADEVYAVIKQLRVGLGDVEQHAKRLTALALMATMESEEAERADRARTAKMIADDDEN